MNKEYRLPRIYQKENTTENARTRQIRGLIKNELERGLSIFPMCMIIAPDGRNITMPDLMMAFTEGSFVKSAQRFDIPESTLRQTTKLVINLLIRKELLPKEIEPLSLSRPWQLKLKEAERDYDNYEAYVGLENDPGFRSQRSLVEAIQVSRDKEDHSSKAEKRLGLLAFLQRFYGWGRTKDQREVVESLLNRSPKTLNPLAEGGKLFLNLVFNAGFKVDESHDSLESQRFHHELLLMYDRACMASDYLVNHKSDLLPIEQFVLECFLAGDTYSEIVSRVRQQQLAVSGEEDIKATHGSVTLFLEHVFQLKEATAPFMRVRIAHEARRILDQSTPLNELDRTILVGIAQGKSYQQIAGELNIDIKHVHKILKQFGIRAIPFNYKDRNAIGRSRQSLYETAQQLPFDWFGKERDLVVLAKLSSSDVPTYEEAAEALQITYEMIAISVARARAMVKRNEQKKRQAPNVKSRVGRLAIKPPK